MKLPVTLLVSLWLAATVLASAYLPRLPDNVATSFDVSGNPRDHAPRRELVSHHLATSTLVMMVFAAIAAWLPHVLISKLTLSDPESLLALERRTTLVGWAQLTIVWLACATQGTVQVVYAVIYEANITSSGIVSPLVIWLAGGLWLVIAVWSVGGLILRFSVGRA